MSTIQHLKRAVQILRDANEDEINESESWSWNLKNWTIQFTNEEDYRSVVAYKVQDNLTNWSQYITLEAQRMEWRTLV